MAYQTINGLKIYFEIHGSGEPVVLLHHGFGCTQMWNEIYPSFVQSGYKILMYDRRGYGKSEKGKDFQEFYVSDEFRPQSVMELKDMLDAVGIYSCHLIGQCEGGVVAIDFAARFPERVNSIITSSTQCYSTIPMTEFNKQKFPRDFKDLDYNLREKLLKWHAHDHAAPFYNQFCRFGGAYGKDIFDLRPVLQKVQCPSLVLYPDRSFLFDVDQGVAFYKNLAKGELAVLPKCGHNTYEHQPEEYVRQALNFLNRVQTAKNDA